MRSYIKSSLLITGGMIIGAALIYAYHKKKIKEVEKIIEEPDDNRDNDAVSVKKNETLSLSDIKDAETKEESVQMSSGMGFKKNMDEYLKIKELYPSPISTYVITEDELGGEDESYDICSLIYHNNGYLVDENGIPWDEKKIYNYLGIDIFECIETAIEDVVCVRNPDLKIDYEIVYSLNPYTPPEDYENRKFYDELQEFDEI